MMFHNWRIIVGNLMDQLKGTLFVVTQEKCITLYKQIIKCVKSVMIIHLKVVWRLIYIFPDSQGVAAKILIQNVSSPHSPLDCRVALCEEVCHQIC